MCLPYLCRVKYGHVSCLKDLVLYLESAMDKLYKGQGVCNSERATLKTQ